MGKATCELCHQVMDGSSCTDTRAYLWPVGVACRDCGVIQIFTTRTATRRAAWCVAISSSCASTGTGRPTG
jgi:hypothetical protein